MTDLYSGKTAAFLTQHGKEHLIGPLFQEALGCTILRAKGYDTDFLGTFSGEIQRDESQLITARKKARIGMELTGASQGIASEGAFVPDPFGGLMPWNIEMLVWLDDENQLEIVGMAQGPARNLQRALGSISELEKFANEAGFPQHHLILRPQTETDTRVRKGLCDWETLQQDFIDCLHESKNQLVCAENDLRAFCNPTRQSMIRRAAEDLIKKISSACPACSMPGFAVYAHHAGLPCRMCGDATKLAKSYLWSCAVCHHKAETPSLDVHAEPSRCDRCNP